MTDLEMDLVIANARIATLEKALAEATAQKSSKCSFGDGITIKPDGVHELDPCVYEIKEIHRNVTVIVRQCHKCGNVDISWTAQEDTEDVVVDE